MAKVYRIENIDGEGIYTACSRSDDMYDMLSNYQDAPRHPTPYQDPKMCGAWSNRDRCGDAEMVFGFSSKAQLKRWFNRARDRKLMDDEGFRVSIYAVGNEDILRGLVQVAFNRTYAKQVGSLDVETLGRG